MGLCGKAFGVDPFFFLTQIVRHSVFVWDVLGGTLGSLDQVIPTGAMAAASPGQHTTASPRRVDSCPHRIILYSTPMGPSWEGAPAPPTTPHILCRPPASMENPWKPMDKSRVFGNPDFCKKSRFENTLVVCCYFFKVVALSSNSVALTFRCGFR